MFNPALDRQMDNCRLVIIRKPVRQSNNAHRATFEIYVTITIAISPIPHLRQEDVGH